MPNPKQGARDEATRWQPVTQTATLPQSAPAWLPHGCHQETPSRRKDDKAGDRLFLHYPALR
eukprot:8102339-Alexandrium_andersonii.AAC.1